MGKKYQKSPYYLGTRLWDTLEEKKHRKFHVNMHSKNMWIRCIRNITR